MENSPIVPIKFNKNLPSGAYWMWTWEDHQWKLFYWDVGQDEILEFGKGRSLEDTDIFAIYPVRIVPPQILREKYSPVGDMNKETCGYCDKPLTSVGSSFCSEECEEKLNRILFED